MRDTRDTATNELDGIDPPPDLAKRRAGILRKTKKNAMGYQGPKERPCCANCVHLVAVVWAEGTTQEHTRERCGIGTFAVQRGAICGQHRRK